MRVLGLLVALLLATALATDTFGSPGSNVGELTGSVEELMPPPIPPPPSDGKDTRQSILIPTTNGGQMVEDIRQGLIPNQGIAVTHGNDDGNDMRSSKFPPVPSSHDHNDDSRRKVFPNPIKMRVTGDPNAVEDAKPPSTVAQKLFGDNPMDELNKLALYFTDKAVISQQKLRLKQRSIIRAKKAKEIRALKPLVQRRINWKRIDAKSVVVSGALGGLGGVLGGFFGSAVLGINMDPRSAFTTGMIAAIVTDIFTQNQLKELGEDVPLIDPKVTAKNAAVGAGVGMITHLLNPDIELFPVIIAGAGGAVVGSWIGAAGDSDFDGDGTLEYGQFVDAFSGKKTVGANDLAKVTGLREQDFYRFMEEVGTEKNIPADEGGEVSLSHICMYLDDDDSGLLGVQELLPLFNGNTVLARRFIHTYDKEITKADETKYSILRANQRVSKFKFWEYLKDVVGRRCNKMEECAVDSDTLMSLTQPTGTFIGRSTPLTYREAADIIKSIHDKMEKNGWLYTSPDALPLQQLWIYLTCPECKLGDSPLKDDIGKRELTELVGTMMRAKNIVLNILHNQL